MNPAERIDLVEIAREVLGVPKAPVMSSDDIIANLRAERDALAERLRQTPELRSIVGELREILELMVNDDSLSAENALRTLLRRLDRESQEPFGLADAKGPLGQD